jgi:hypothetical protein
MSDAETNKALSLLRGTPTARGAAPYTGALMQVLDDASGETLVPTSHYSTFADAYRVGRRAARHKIFQHATRAAVVRFEFSRGCFNPTSAREIVFKAKQYRTNLPKGAAPDAVLRNRHTRIARGMTKTAYRSAHSLDGAPMSESVRGTSDRLTGVQYFTRANPCQSCGCTCRRARLALNDNGRRKLRRLARVALEKVGARLDALRAEAAGVELHRHGAPPVCTARWTADDFDNWRAQQTALNAKAYRLRLLCADLDARRARLARYV